MKKNFILYVKNVMMVNYREPHPDENCQFKDWFDAIIHSGITSEWGDNIMKTLLEGTKKYIKIQR